MRASPTSWIVPGLLALSVIYSIYLGFRVGGLEGELARLRSGQPSSGAGSASEGPNGGPLPVTAEEKLVARLESIEDDLSDLQENYASLDEQLASGKAAGGAAAADESRILDVVSKAEARVRARQLEFHSAQWRRSRAQVAEDFGAKHSLERWQTDQVKKLLEEEAEAAATILADPASVENPELMAVEWQRKLDETDREALQMLQEGTPAAQAWVAARMFERQVLWPWLPSLQPQAQR